MNLNFCAKAPSTFLRIGILTISFLLSVQVWGQKIAGVSVVSPSRKVEDQWVQSVQQINANWVAVMPYAFGQANSAQLNYDLDHQWWGERFEGIQTITHQAKAKGLKVMLKPMVWVQGSWAGGFELSSEKSWLEWENRYESYILKLTEIAVAENVEMLCIGTELKQVCKLRPTFMRRLIDKVRTVYKGKITYAANWDDYFAIKFWDKVDYLGVDAYFPLSPSKQPSVSELKAAWAQQVRKLAALSKAYNKPILFTEFGYRSIDLCCWEQWLRENLPHDSEVNLVGQTNAYRAFFESFWHQPWFAGVFIWQWYTHHERAGGMNNSDFTPQNKPAAKTISDWFAK